LSEAGYEVSISPPTLVLGKGTLISTLDFQRLVVPLHTELGDIHIHIALREAHVQPGERLDLAAVEAGA
jgi:chemotaxis protein CheX